jgi:hypothetical protein
MKPHVPTSAVLEQLLKEAPPDHVTLAWLTGSLRERSFGLVMLIMALAGLVRKHPLRTAGGLVSSVCAQR